jgi:CDP-diacylglycerol--serine O-phosphatidyltransferase
MIGYYNPSVILTYTGLIFAVLGIARAANGDIKTALFFLMLCGLCDMFDGSIARLIKRNDNEKQFGIQIDSLCDLVCFAVFPAVICYFADKANALRVICMCVYILAAVIRLAYFNVMSLASHVEIYRGLPVTSAAGFFPLILVLSALLNLNTGNVSNILLLVMSAAFIADVRIKKIHKLGKIVVIALGVTILAGVLLYGNNLN